MCHLPLTKGEVGALTAKSLRFSPQSLTHPTSHNKHAFKQSFKKNMICNTLQGI